MKYYHCDKKYPCLVGIRLRATITLQIFTTKYNHVQHLAVQITKKRDDIKANLAIGAAWQLTSNFCRIYNVDRRIYSATKHIFSSVALKDLLLMRNLMFI